MIDALLIFYMRIFSAFLFWVFFPWNFKFQTQLFPFGMEVMRYLLNLGIEVLMMGFVGSSWLDP